MKAENSQRIGKQILHFLSKRSEFDVKQTQTKQPTLFSWWGKDDNHFAT
jgi:hypothetical protein